MKPSDFLLLIFVLHQSAGICIMCGCQLEVKDWCRQITYKLSQMEASVLFASQMAALCCKLVSGKAVNSHLRKYSLPRHKLNPITDMYSSKCPAGWETNQLMAGHIWEMIWAISETVTEEIHSKYFLMVQKAEARVRLTGHYQCMVPGMQYFSKQSGLRNPLSLWNKVVAGLLSQSPIMIGRGSFKYQCVI